MEGTKKLYEYPDWRMMKAVVYTMISSGIRVGAWDYLRWGNIRPIHEGSKFIAARIVVYYSKMTTVETIVPDSAAN